MIFQQPLFSLKPEVKGNKLQSPIKDKPSTGNFFLFWVSIHTFCDRFTLQLGMKAHTKRFLRDKINDG